jgi:hypothetical protein
MEPSYGLPSNFASKQISFIVHIGEIYCKGLVKHKKKQTF